MAEFNLDKFDGKHPHSLTRSQRQLVALASVLVNKPELIILDEPTKYMDLQLIAKIMDVIKPNE